MISKIIKLGFSLNQCLFIIFILVLIFALSQHMGKCIMNFPLASYLSHIANFISHGEMHEEFPIRLFFCPFIYQLSHPMGKCMKNFSLLCICCFVGSTFTSNWEVHWEFAFGFLFACSYYQLSHHMGNVGRISHWLSSMCPFYHHLARPFYILEPTSQGHISVI